MNKKLQVFIDNQWLYVFCSNPLKAKPVTTDKREKALNCDAKSYFMKKYSGFDFRIV